MPRHESNPYSNKQALEIPTQENTPDSPLTDNSVGPSHQPTFTHDGENYSFTQKILDSRVISSFHDAVPLNDSPLEAELVDPEHVPVKSSNCYVDLPLFSAEEESDNKRTPTLLQYDEDTIVTLPLNNVGDGDEVLDASFEGNDAVPLNDFESIVSENEFDIVNNIL